MQAGNGVLFDLHQFIILSLCLFFMFGAWRDIYSGSFDKLKRLNKQYIGILLVTLGLGVGLLYFMELGPQGLIVSFSLGLLVSLSIYDPKYAVGFFIFMLISRPWEIVSSPLMMSLPRDTFALCFLSFIAHKLIRKRFYFQWNWATACVVFFSVWAFFAVVVSGHVAYGMQKYEEIFSKGIIVYLLIVNVVDKKEYVLPVVVALVLGITEKSVMSFYNSAILGITADGDRLVSVGILENSNDIAAIMVLAVPLTLAFARNLTNLLLKYVFIFLVSGFYGYLIWQSKSRGAVLAIGALIIGMFWIKAKNKRIASIIVGLGLVLSVSAISLIKRDAEDIEGSTNNRKIYWTTAVKMGVKRPIFGVGPFGYPLNLFTFSDGHVGSEGRYKTAHSTWLLALAENGIPGFVFYMGIWFFAFKASWSMKDMRPEFFLALLSYATAITFLSHTYMLYPYILLGIIIATAKFYAPSREKVQVNGLHGAQMRKGWI